MPAIVLIAHSGWAEGMDTLLTYKHSKYIHLSDFDEKGNTALHYACAHGHSKIVAALLDSCADIDVQAQQTVHFLSRSPSISS
jgi:ankyrin repeat protein